ncbi:hypothetical protein JJ685_11240 [Ramlibacter monticola]|uniref:DUF4398 domain-containing protein n=1 Tax=Ramlibacter monticola TaxID=1926872 RepID=A0A937CSP5_9BURK|nr:hypothetical protein [Ramlibacter monticola]MBL0391710.1 hypothetical protein [Ramlibacter monticola]
MFKQRKKHLMGVALALALGAAGVVAGTEAATSKDAYKAAQDRIEAQAKAQRQACGRFQANAKDVCQVQAAGWEKVAKAQLEAAREPGPETEKKVKFARADADHAVARQRCAVLKDRAKDRCMDQAKNDREAAIRLAKVEKVEEVNALKAKTQEQRHAQQKAAPRS